MPYNAIAVGLGPKWLGSIIGFVVSFGVRRRIARLTRKITPMFHRRLAFLSQPEGHHFEEPRDFFQMMLRYARRKRPLELASLPTMAARLCIANFTSVHQTSFAAMNLVLNMVSSDAEFGTIEALRDEFKSVSSNKDGDTDSFFWNKANLQRLAKADSLCRETLRLHAFPQRFAPRTVMADGLYTPDGHALPKGTIVTFFAGPVHRDPEIYKEPLKVDPWRFLNRVDHAGLPTTESLVSVTSDFLSWGRGRHACSGRQLVDFELKMLIAYIFLNYDVKLPERYGGVRPSNIWRSEVEFPPPDACIVIKRRELD
jgi:tenellin biosynthesis cytochrome P450 monooxygenase